MWKMEYVKLEVELGRWYLEVGIGGEGNVERGKRGKGGKGK